MSANAPAPGPNQQRPTSWSDLTTAQKTGAYIVIAVVVLCCGGIIAAINDDPDPSAPPSEVATDTETTASATPTEPDPTTSSAPTEDAETTSDAPEPEPTTTKAAEPEVHYDNCDDARADGTAPLYEGDPGYRSGLDRDGDGVACEDSSSSGSDSGGGSSGGGGGSDDGGSDVYYANCTEAQEAGAAPLYRGDPGYGSHLDRDGDGVACET